MKAANADSGIARRHGPAAPGTSSRWPTRRRFDPNDPGAASAADRGNRALSDVYEPGSTSKVMTAAAAIQEGRITPDTPVTVPPVLRTAGHVFHDDVSHGTEHLTLTGVLAKSSNLGAILAAETIGPDKLYSYLKKFGIGEPTGDALPRREPRHPAPAAAVVRLAVRHVAFGQGLSLNAVQAASVYATIANDGVRVEPTLVAGHDRAGRHLHPEPPRRKATRVVSAQTAADGARHARVRRVRPGHRADGPHPRLPGRGQDRYGEPGRRDLPLLPRLHRVVHRLRTRPTTRAWSSRSPCRTPSNGHFGGRLGRTRLQAGHGVRAAPPRRSRRPPTPPEAAPGLRAVTA